MKVCVFLGPTLPAIEAKKIIDAEYLPPAVHGDIYRLTLRDPKPLAVGLIDGSFRHQPAVRHKEILWALSQGIHVFGSASMGALRAAELAAFGMIGVGAIFEGFRDGRLEDDDEVAVDYGPAELGYPALNDAMVDIRAALDLARDQGVIDGTIEAGMLQIAKSLFYPERSHARVAAEYARVHGSVRQAENLQDWFQEKRPGRKAKDAVALLQKLRDLSVTPFQPAFVLQRTEFWESDVAVACADS